ncbi:hypothetical protein OKN36_21260 [Furfurilactobacillus sp. OKN36]
MVEFLTGQGGTTFKKSGDQKARNAGLNQRRKPYFRKDCLQLSCVSFMVKG